MSLQVISPHQEGGISEHTLDGICEMVLHNDARFEGKLVEIVFFFNHRPFLLIWGSSHPDGVSFFQSLYEFQLRVLQVILN